MFLNGVEDLELKTERPYPYQPKTRKETTLKKTFEIYQCLYFKTTKSNFIALKFHSKNYVPYFSSNFSFPCIPSLDSIYCRYNMTKYTFKGNDFIISS